MLERLEQLINDVSTLNSKLILLIAPPNSGKSKLLRDASEQLALPLITVGVALGLELLPIPIAQRPLKAAELLRVLAAKNGSQTAILFDDIEILFDSTLKLDPIELLKRQARAIPVVVAWPGDMAHGRLTYATAGHPEHRDYAIDGFAPFDVN